MVVTGDGVSRTTDIPGATLEVLDGVGAQLPRRVHAQVAAAVLTHTAP
jgi:hypothetical protein